MTKYRLGNETRLWRWQDGSTPCTTLLRQIIAAKDFNDVTSGTKGGWVEDEHALARDGDCWVYDENSVVFAGADIRQRPPHPTLHRKPPRTRRRQQLA